MSGYNTLMHHAASAAALSHVYRDTEAHYTLGVSLGVLAAQWRREATALAVQACRRGFHDPYRDCQYGQIAGCEIHLTENKHLWGPLWEDRRICGKASLALKESLLLQALTWAMSPGYRASTPGLIPFSDIPNTKALYTDADARRHFVDAVAALRQEMRQERKESYQASLQCLVRKYPSRRSWS